MTTVTLVLLSLTLGGLFTSICALYVARRSSAQSQLKRLSEHSTRLDELSLQLESLTVQLRNLRSRLNMASYRDRKASRETTEAPDEPADSPEAWKRAMNRQLALKGAPR